MLLKKHCVVPENIHSPPWRVVLVCPPPPGNSSLGSYFPLKILAFKTPLLLGISNDPALRREFNLRFSPDDYLKRPVPVMTSCRRDVMISTRKVNKTEVSHIAPTTSLLLCKACLTYVYNTSAVIHLPARPASKTHKFVKRRTNQFPSASLWTLKLLSHQR